MTTAAHDRPEPGAKLEPGAERETDRGTRSGAALWLWGLLPLVLLAVLLAVIVRSDATSAIRGDAPPVEALVYGQVRLVPAGIVLDVLNDGPDPVRIAQVTVDEAYWAFTQQPAGALGHLAGAEITIPYPWVEGEAHELRLVTETGVTFDHTIEVAVESPGMSGRALGLFALIGLYVGVLPVALGLLWLPMVRRLPASGLAFVLALTLGLLAFLLIDTGHEGLEIAGGLAESFQGTALLIMAAVAAYLAIDSFGRWLSARRSGSAAWTSALLVAVGIGLHNFAEGLAIGAAFALGEVALGTLLIVGFTLHNTTEGLAIVAPLANERVSIGRLVLLGLIAGAPTILGAWFGGFAYSPFWSVVFLGAGVGAIAQVIVQIARGMSRDQSFAQLARTGPVVAGLAVGFAVMYTTGLLVG